MLHDIHAREITSQRLRDGQRFSLVERAVAERRERRKAGRKSRGRAAPRPEAAPQGSPA